MERLDEVKSWYDIVIHYYTARCTPYWCDKKEWPKFFNSANSNGHRKGYGYR